LLPPAALPALLSLLTARLPLDGGMDDEGADQQGAGHAAAAQPPLRSRRRAAAAGRGGEGRRLDGYDSTTRCLLGAIGAAGAFAAAMTTQRNEAHSRNLLCIGDRNAPKCKLCTQLQNP